MIPTIVAILAPMVNSIQQIPQLYRTYKTKKVRNISFYSLLLILITNLLWLAHGYFIMDYPLIISGIISTFINTNLLFLYWFYL